MSFLSLLSKKIHDYRLQKIQHIKVGQTQSYIYLKKRRYICKDLKQLKNFKTIAQDNNVCIPTVIRYMNYSILLNNKHLSKLPKKI